MPVGGFPEIFDSSMLATYKSCPELFRKNYIEHWRAKEPSVHLHAGGAFAKAMEVTRKAFYTGEIITPGKDDSGQLCWFTFQENPATADDAIALGLQALLAYYGNFQCPEDSAKSASRMAGAFEYYWSQYPLSWDDFVPVQLPGGKRGIEFSFAHPIDVIHPATGNPILYVGKLDAIVETLGGVFINDEKTTSSLGASWSRQWDLRSQFTGYAWGASKSGLRVDGAIVRGISILKTKYDTQQAISYRPEWQIDRWYTELCGWIEDIKENWINCYTGLGKGATPRKAFRYNLDHACADWGGCGFRQACSSQDERPWLETSFERREWNPLLREERKL
jgi:hypothetical protein